MDFPILHDQPNRSSNLPQRKITLELNWPSRGTLRLRLKVCRRSNVNRPGVLKGEHSATFPLTRSCSCTNATGQDQGGGPVNSIKP
jgi:hypothetical protein